MRSVALSLTLAVLTCVPALASSAKQVELISGGTQVPLHVVGTISSSSAKVGDVFDFAAAQDVTVDGRIAIKKGAQGHGEIASVTKAGGSGHSGSLGLKFDWIYAVDGGKILLSDTAQSSAEQDRKGASSTATIIGIATFGVGGLFGHNFAHGKDMTIDESKPLNAFVASNVHVATTESAVVSADHFDH